MQFDKHSTKMGQSLTFSLGCAICFKNERAICTAESVLRLRWPWSRYCLIHRGSFLRLSCRLNRCSTVQNKSGKAEGLVFAWAPASRTMPKNGNASKRNHHYNRVYTTVSNMLRLTRQSDSRTLSANTVSSFSVAMI